MPSLGATRIVRRTVAGLALMLAFPATVFGQIPEPPRPTALCRASLESYVQDRQLNGHWEGSAVVLKKGGVDYVCQCTSATRPPECKPKGSSGAAGSGGSDLSRFSPGQQAALTTVQTLVEGLFSAIFSGGKSAGSGDDLLKARQDMLARQEAERQQALEKWNAFQEEEKQRRESEAEIGRRDLLARVGGTSGQGMNFQSVSGEKLGYTDWAARNPGAAPLPSGKYPSPATAPEQARCAAYFSERASGLSAQGKQEEAQFMSQQAQKAMTGELLDAPCQAVAPGAGSDAQKAGDRAAVVNEVLAQYNTKIKELLDLSQKLAAVRKQKLEAETRIQEADAKIADLKSQAAAATGPEEKQKCDDLRAEALALRGQSETDLKTATENESACLASAREAESQVKELGSKLQEGPPKK